MAGEQGCTNATVCDIQAAGNQTDINAGSKRDTSSSGIFLIGTENARLHTSDCVAPTSINLIDLEPRWAPPELPPPCCWTEVDQSCAGGHNSITTQCQRLLFTTWNEYTHIGAALYIHCSSLDSLKILLNFSKSYLYNDQIDYFYLKITIYF